jgi:hypothetical protein
MRLRTKNHCAGKCEQQFSSQSVSSRQNPPLNEKDDLVQTSKRIAKNNSVVVGPSETQNRDLLCWQVPTVIYPTDS